MKEWSELVGSIQSVSEGEKRKIEMVARLVESIVDRRKELGLTQDEVARRAGIRQSAVARLEGGSAIPRLDTLVKIAISLGMDIQFIKSSMDEQAAARFAG